ncbi:MAG: GIY-YIG nuclease family protein [Ruminococcus sp.]|nr:GIY-YIG nuclease family protein [Ruminococcus sp.]
MKLFPICNIPKIEKVGIYAIYCKATNKYYIGSSNNVYTRLAAHCRELRLHGGIGVTAKLDEDVKRHGLGNIEFAILETFEDNELKYEELYEIEKEYVIKYNSIFPNGYNTYLPNPTNNKKRGVLIKATTIEESRNKRKEYIKNTTIGCKLEKEQAKRFKAYAASQGTTANALLKQFVLDTIKSPV